jgi:hypothetical protein
MEQRKLTLFCYKITTFMVISHLLVAGCTSLTTGAGKNTAVPPYRNPA